MTALRTMIVLAVGIAAGSSAAVAGERFRTPAEVELRRQHVAARLETIRKEAEVVAATLDQIAARLATAVPTEHSGLHRDARVLCVRQRALDEEAAVLRDEQAVLAAIPTRSATGPLQQGDPQGIGTFDLSGSGDPGTSPRAFNPAISIIPDINYYTDNRRGRAYPLARQADGFTVPGEDDPSPTDPARGFNLREVEAAFMGTIDPYFDVWATFVVQGDQIQAEEAYVQTRQFVPGLQLRFGKFLSGIGYINRQHPHQWGFFDQALAYDAILGGGLADTGVQLTWLPALPVYALLGFEALQGDNARVANRVVSDFPDFFEEKAGPRLLTGFLRVSPNVGYSSALQVGLSYAHSRGHQEAREEAGVLEEGLEGRSRLAGADVVWRYESGRAYGRGNATLQAEYLYRSMDLQQLVAHGIATAGGPTRRSGQDGLYVQALYGIAARWTIGGRVDVLGLRNRIDVGGARIDFAASSRLTANATFNPTEFSRIRAQYSHGRARSGGNIDPVHQMAVQFQMSLGAHGAHRF